MVLKFRHMDEFTKREAADISQLPMRAVQYYTERGLLEPEVNLGEGKGSTRLYSRKNLVEMALIKRFSDYGMSFPNVRHIMSFLEDTIATWDRIDLPAFLMVYTLKKGMHHVELSGKAEANLDLLKASYSVFIIDFGAIAKKMRDLGKISETLHMQDDATIEVDRKGD